MKHFPRNIFIGVLILSGLILAIPFTPFRRSFNSSLNNYKNLAYEKIGVSKLKNEKIEKVIAYSLQKDKPVEFNKTIISNDGSYNWKINNYATLDESNKKNSNGISVFINQQPTLNTNSNNQQSNTNSPLLNVSNNTTTNSNQNITGNNLNSSQIMSTSASLNNQAGSISSGKQSANGNPPPSDGTTDTPPIGTLPISDGSCFMAILSAVFVFFKYRKVNL